MFEKAFKTTTIIKVNYIKSETIMEITTFLAKYGLFEESISTAASIMGTSERAQALSSIAMILMEHGQSVRANNIFETAINTANSITIDLGRSQTFFTIARILA
ncbi:MAG: hypothetical protein CL916_15290 [Deltaproteobacteria bacterium]|nr:hypothetical protein [Deltaproteobacteria bacterium]